MTIFFAPDGLVLRDIVRPHNQILWGQATAEPQTLIDRLIEQREEIGPVSVFMGSSFSKTLRPEHSDYIRMSGIGGIGTLRRFTQAGCLAIIPCHVGQIYQYIEDGLIRCDVAFVQVSAKGPGGMHSLGVAHDYTRTMIDKARVVVAEINDQVPYTYGGTELHPDAIDVAIQTSRPLVEVGPSVASPAEIEAARLTSGYIDDGTTLQVGIGGVPDAILRLIADRRDLGVHSGMLSDGFIDLIENGAVTNTAKPFDKGVSITGLLIGTKRLYDFCHLNKAVGLRPSAYTHGEAVLAAIPKLVTVNSAVEVDLTGQVNAEQVADSYMGGVGGHADYVRSGHRSPGGHSIIAMTSTAAGGKISRIKDQLSGAVTSSRSDVDIVVTEFGVAELRAQTLAERARRLIAIAHPAFREDLDRHASAIFKRGF